MTADPVPPRFLSIEFHARFFPRLLRDRFSPRKCRETQGTTFTSTTEMIILLAGCLVLAVIGIPLAVTGGTIAGWVLTVVGVGGTILLFVMSVAARWGQRPSYDDFLVGIFAFFVSLGVLAGIAVGMDSRSPGLGILAGIGGAAAGYVLGIFAGLRMQHLGWMASIVNMLAGFAAIVATAGGVIASLFVALG